MLSLNAQVVAEHHTGDTQLKYRENSSGLYLPEQPAKEGEMSKTPPRPLYSIITPFLPLGIELGAQLDLKPSSRISLQSSMFPPNFCHLTSTDVTHKLPHFCSHRFFPLLVHPDLRTPKGHCTTLSFFLQSEGITPLVFQWLFCRLQTLAQLFCFCGPQFPPLKNKDDNTTWPSNKNDMTVMD